MLGLPETMLGLFPGGGGVTRLPRLIGVREALDVILTGRNIRPRAAKKMGLVDQVVSEESLLAAARRAAGLLAAHKLEPHLHPKSDVARVLLEHNPVGRRVLFNQARKTVQRKTLGLYPAPLVAIDLIERDLTLPLDEALAQEPPAFAELAVGPGGAEPGVAVPSQQRARRSKRSRAPRARSSRAQPIHRLGMVGGGFMGADIAVVSAEKGIETRIRDIAPEPLGKALAHCKSYFDRRAKSLGERHVFKARSRVSGSLELAGFRHHGPHHRGSAREPRPQAGRVRPARGDRAARRRSWRATPRRCRSARSGPSCSTRTA